MQLRTVMPEVLDDPIAEFVVGLVVAKRILEVADPSEDTPRTGHDVWREESRIQELPFEIGDEALLVRIPVAVPVAHRLVAESLDGEKQLTLHSVCLAARRNVELPNPLGFLEVVHG